jgi:hypothetical protein
MARPSSFDCGESGRKKKATKGGVDRRVDYDARDGRARCARTMAGIYLFEHRDGRHRRHVVMDLRS